MNAQRSGTVQPRREKRRDANRKKTASTARRIRRSAFSQLLAIVVLVDALGLFLAVAGWCYQRDSTYLDGQYACFGYVTDGMDVVDAVCEAAQPTDGNGTIPADQQPVITAIRVID